MTLPPLHLIAEDPAALAELTPAQLVGIISSAAAALCARAGDRVADRLIGPEEAAGIVGLSARYIRRHPGLPFVRRPEGGKRARIKCSLRGCQEYAERLARRRAG